jgi:hypothetical protein
MVQVNVTFGHINPKPGFVSAWDAAKAHYGENVFARMSRDEQIQAVRDYVNR